MDGRYIYGIITDGNETVLDVSGLGGSSQVYTIAHKGLSCVVSDYSGREFGSMPKEEVVQCLLAHQVVLEHVVREHTVLPVKFGTVLATSDEVRNLLAQGHQQFVAALAWIQDKVEVEVAATWDTGQVLREIGTEPRIMRAREAIGSRPGQPTLEGRIYLGQMVKSLMDQRRDSYRERMISFLKPLAVDVQPNALVSDEMVMNVAFLVQKASQAEFDSHVRYLNGLFHDQIDFRIIGPLPPYSFATVEVARPSLEKIEEARQLLHLGDVISEPEVRKAYRRLAAETHPDRRPGDELAKTQFARLRQASDLLIAYCRGQAESGGSLLINIRRLRDEEVEHLRFAEIEVVAGATDG
jgi:hypothetical protein